MHVEHRLSTAGLKWQSASYIGQEKSPRPPQSLFNLRTYARVDSPTIWHRSCKCRARIGKGERGNGYDDGSSVGDSRRRTGATVRLRSAWTRFAAAFREGTPVASVLVMRLRNARVGREERAGRPGDRRTETTHAPDSGAVYRDCPAPDRVKRRASSASASRQRSTSSTTTYSSVLCRPAPPGP